MIHCVICSSRLDPELIFCKWIFTIISTENIDISTNQRKNKKEKRRKPFDFMTCQTRNYRSQRKPSSVILFQQFLLWFKAKSISVYLQQLQEWKTRRKKKKKLQSLLIKIEFRNLFFFLCVKISNNEYRWEFNIMLLVQSRISEKYIIVDVGWNIGKLNFILWKNWLLKWVIFHCISVGMMPMHFSIENFRQRKTHFSHAISQLLLFAQLSMFDATQILYFR